MKQILTALLLILIILPFFYLSNHYLDVLIFLALMVGSFEIVRIFPKWPLSIKLLTPIFMAIMSFLGCYYPQLVSVSIIAITLIYNVWMMLNENMNINDVAITLLVLIILLGAIQGYNALQEVGRFAFLAAILITILNDTGAYFVGSFLGKHKLIERVSPNKTIEGSVSGLLLGTIIGFILFRFLTKLPNLVIIILVIGISIMGQLGDLFFSIIKRHYGIKDYGNYLKGHGGILDRIDSIVFGLIYAYIVLVVFRLL